MPEIGEKLKELRQSKKMTQKTLAEILNVTPQAISKWERNKSQPDLQTLIDLSKCFNITIDEMLGNKRPSFFDGFFSKKRGRDHMGKMAQKLKENTPQNHDNRKKVIIFDKTFSLISDKGLLQTQMLNRKLELLMQENQQKIDVDTYNSNQVDQYGQLADAILLTPTFAYAKDSLEKKFTGTPVIAISKKDYGVLAAEKIYHQLITVLKH
ncbi:helix-turn-helix domain-containing protein [Vagococcus sp. BWB3-3]|uniref:Helix-turn-helix domain-containing protein n=1 Tax=Vagococcus allomyrinae TaxID=2794353 RepID=A0A940SU43_9ENTE|nr:helix-turn-helix domain-containing protein [Vagococcus allomyrinae]MBP1040950.1 helix-turn-helix domain-containing protein [Vagococcus allomyrinae]